MCDAFPPRLVERAHWKGEACSTALDICCELMSPTTMPRTPPLGLHNAVMRPNLTTSTISSGTVALARSWASHQKRAVSTSLTNKGRKRSAVIPNGPPAALRRGPSSSSRRGHDLSQRLVLIHWGALHVALEVAYSDPEDLRGSRSSQELTKLLQERASQMTTLRIGPEPVPSRHVAECHRHQPFCVVSESKLHCSEPRIWWSKPPHWPAAKAEKRSLKRHFGMLPSRAGRLSNKRRSNKNNFQALVAPTGSFLSRARSDSLNAKRMADLQ